MEEDGVKEDPTQCKEPKFLAKAGWVKKAPGKLLANYKDRYIHVEKTEIVVYENEDLQKCLERHDLENYDKCHELKSPFKKRHRLVLSRSAKSGNKVSDLKFQAQTAEEKEAWIKALSDGINRAKNKILDEVKVTEDSTLEHVTRTRPKGTRNRRPPTRMHMKEVAIVSSDGNLRLDLDLEDAVMPNGSLYVNVDGTKTPNEAIKARLPLSSNDVETPLETSGEEETQTESDIGPQKKAIKPPMPPIKEAKDSSVPEDEPDKNKCPEKKVLKPPMPPSKEAKLSISPTEDTEDTEDTVTEQPNDEKVSEKSPDAKKKTVAPPMPPSKPNSRRSVCNLIEPTESMTSGKPPTPPSKENKPFHPAVHPDQEVLGIEDDNEENAGDNRKETSGTDIETDKRDPAISEQADGDSTSPSAEVGGLEESEDKKGRSVDLLPQDVKSEDIITCPQTISDNLDTLLQADVLPQHEVPSAVVSLNDSLDESLTMDPLLSDLPGEKERKAEEKSVDSGQHSDDDSEGSGGEVSLSTSTAALRGSQPSLEKLDTSEDSIQISASLRQTQADSKSHVKSAIFPFPHTRPTPPLKPKVKSSSISDLLSESCVFIQVTPPVTHADGVAKLETEVALEMKKTDELLSRVTEFQGEGDSESKDLLAEALEKLKKADDVLREVQKLKVTKNIPDRKSW